MTGGLPALGVVLRLQQPVSGSGLWTGWTRPRASRGRALLLGVLIVPPWPPLTPCVTRPHVTRDIGSDVAPRQSVSQTGFGRVSVS